MKIPSAANDTDNAAAATTRQQILNAALEVFAEFGFTGAATREIARRARVHQPAIAYHFKSKELLWKAAADAVFEEFSSTLETGLKDTVSDGDRLRRLAEIYVRFVARKPAWATFIIQEGMQANERNDWLVKTWLRPQSRKLYQMITSRDWPTSESAAIGRAISVLSVLTGSTLIFAQQAQVKRLAAIDTNSPAFLERHVQTVFLVLETLRKAC